MELKGLKGAAAYQTYLRVIFYLLLVREAMDTKGKDFPAIVDEFKMLDDKDKKLVFIELLAISPISDQDTIRLCAVHKDDEEVSYSTSNIHNLTGLEILELCLETLQFCSKHGDDLFF